jgi:hypothetical protein
MRPTRPLPQWSRSPLWLFGLAGHAENQPDAPFPAKLGFLAVVKRFGCTAKGEHTSAWSRGPTCRALAIIAHLGVRGAVGAP